MISKSLLFIGVKGTVLAIDRVSGLEVWRTKLEGSEFVNLAVQDGELYASTHGGLFCLEPATGALRWRNPLKGLGYGLVSIATASGTQTIVMRAKQEQDEAAAAGTTAIG
jgi:outer membrane protein assembly factor BamB